MWAPSQVKGRKSEFVAGHRALECIRGWRKVNDANCYISFRALCTVLVYTTAASTRFVDRECVGTPRNEEPRK